MMQKTDILSLNVMKQWQHRLYSFFFRCWWTLLVLLMAYGLYLHGMQKKRELLTCLHEKVMLLKQKVSLAKESQDDLLRQIESQSDPAWIEILMRKHLGMVPSGQTKVYFEQDLRASSDL